MVELHAAGVAVKPVMLHKILQFVAPVLPEFWVKLTAPGRLEKLVINIKYHWPATAFVIVAVSTAANE